MMNETETTYQDLKYWKNNNYYDVDALINELQN